MMSLALLKSTRRNFAKYASLETVSGSGRSSDTSGSAGFGSVPLVKYTTEPSLETPSEKSAQEQTALQKTLVTDGTKKDYPRKKCVA